MLIGDGCCLLITTLHQQIASAEDRAKRQRAEDSRIYVDIDSEDSDPSQLHCMLGTSWMMWAQKRQWREQSDVKCILVFLLAQLQWQKFVCFFKAQTIFLF